MSDKANIRTELIRISDCLALINAADGLTLGQVCSLSGLEPSTIQNWIKRGYVPHPKSKKYYERHLARILLISQLRESMQIDRVGELLGYVNGDADDEGDDIISEQDLYDLFCDITDELCKIYPPPDSVENIVVDHVAKYDDSADQRLVSALKVMAMAFMSSLYKQEADKRFAEILR